MSPDPAGAPAEGNPRRPRRSTDEVRRLLIEAGRDDFQDRGFTGASVRDIAEHADVKESVLFRHFGTKAALFERAVLDPLVEFLDGYKEQWSPPETTTAEVEVLVEGYLGGLYDVALRNRKLILALMSAHAFEPELFGEINQEPGLHTILDKITELTVMHQEAHDLTLPDPSITTRVSFAMALGMALLDEWLFPQDNERPDARRITAELTAFQLHGVTHRPGTPVEDSVGTGPESPVLRPSRRVDMYDPHDLLARIDENAGWILVAFAFAMVFQTVWLVECVRLARREQVYTMPLFCTFFWFAHDSGYVVRFHEWFFVYDHWFLKIFWFGLLSAVVLELLFFSQVVKYGREETLPGISTRTFIVGLIVVQIGSTVTWELFKYMANDPLYQFAPLLTQIAYPFFGLAMLVRRRSTRGQNVTMWTAFTAMTLVWNLTTAIWYGPDFRAWPYLAGGAVAVIGGLLMIYAVKTGPREKQNAEIAVSSAG